MTKMRSFKVNESLSPYQESLAKEYSASFITDEDGNDWYEIQKELNNVTWKVVVDFAGVVVAFNQDASTLFPVGCSVVDVEEIPDDLDNNGLWMYDFNLSKFSYNYIKEAESEKEKRLNEIGPRIQYLSDKKDDGDITEGESSKLLMFRSYRADVRNVDVNKAPDIVWPDVPQ